MSKKESNSMQGLYKTPEKLAEILTALTMNDPYAKVLEPCCGAGTIVEKIVDYKQGELLKNEIKGSVWAADKSAKQLNVLHRTFVDASIPAFIFERNLFDLMPGMLIQNLDGRGYSEVPHFDVVLANLPFIDFNTTDRRDEKYFKAIEERVSTETGLSLSKRTDAYAYMMFALWDALKEGGKAGFVVSNSWLGTAAGKTFFKALRWFYNVKSVWISGNGLWFKQSKAVATMMILEKKAISKPNEERILFGRTLKPIEEWDEDFIQTVVASQDARKSLDENILFMQDVTADEIKFVEQTVQSFNMLFHNYSWMEQLEGKVIPIKNRFNVVRGQRTGQDEIFYFDGQGNEKVHSSYLVRLIQSSKDLTRLNPKVKKEAFYCQTPRQELDEKTRAYVESFDGRLNQSLLSKGFDWHITQDAPLVQLFTSINPYERIFFGYTNNKVMINQRLVGFIPLDNTVDMELHHALFNSIVGIFFVESAGFGMGEGLLDLKKGSFEKMWMLNAALLDTKTVDAIKKAFYLLQRRAVLDTKEEFEYQDRKDFDLLVLKAFGIEHLYEQMKETILSQQKARLSVK